MRVDIWSDIICPFCFIGKNRLETVAKEMNIDLEINWHSFELDPSAPKKYEASLVALIEKKYNLSTIEAIKSQVEIAKIAKKENIIFNWEEAKPGNSFDAHRIIKYAETVGLGSKAKNEFFLAYMTNGEEIGSRPTQEMIAKKIGLDMKIVEKILDHDDYSEDVRKDESVARNTFRISGVPFFVFNDKYTISGAQPREVFYELLTTLITETSSAAYPVDPSVDAPSCDVGSCSIPNVQNRL